MRVRAILLAFSCIVPAAGAQTAGAPNPAAARADSLFDAHALPQAAAAYAAIARADSGSGRAWARLGTTMHLMGKYDDAIADYRRALRIAPMNASVMYNLAAAHARLHHADSAFAWLRQATQMGFASEQTLVADSDFAELRSDARFDSARVAMRDALHPCEKRAESRRFDFWVGDWDVVNAQGQRAGTSSVKLLLGGCALYENWTDRQGGEGKSLSSYNTDVRMWQQFWTDQYGRVTEYRESSWDGSTLRYLAHQQMPQGPALLRMSFTPIDTATVRQHGEISLDKGKTWRDSYDLYYHRRAP